MSLTPLTRAGAVLGLGLGGFFDGIVLHQILGWHHLICTTATCQAASIEHLKQQNTQDGFFHLGVWILTILGVALLFQAAKRRNDLETGKVLTGAILSGWGTFNFVEGLIDHQILGDHHVLPGNPHQLLFDMLFLFSGVLLFAGGALLARSNQSAQRVD